MTVVKVIVPKGVQVVVEYEGSLNLTHNDLCTGCGVPPGTSHWDNCRHHPPFSQPMYYGGGK